MVVRILGQVLMGSFCLVSLSMVLTLVVLSDSNAIPIPTLRRGGDYYYGKSAGLWSVGINYAASGTGPNFGLNAIPVPSVGSWR